MSSCCRALRSAPGTSSSPATRARSPIWSGPPGSSGSCGFAQGIGPTLDLVIPRDGAGRLTTPTTLVADAHARGLVLHPYTMRNENTFLPADFRRGTDPNAYGDVFGALRVYFEAGIDGIFSDNPDTALLAAADFAKD